MLILVVVVTLLFQESFVGLEVRGPTKLNRFEVLMTVEFQNHRTFVTLSVSHFQHEVGSEYLFRCTLGPRPVLRTLESELGLERT